MEQHQNDVNVVDLESLMARFCQIILTNKDCLNYSKAENFIRSISDIEKDFLHSVTRENDRALRSVVLTQLIVYLQTFQAESATLGSPFDFDNADSFLQYRKNFEQVYCQINECTTIPYAFSFAFDYIQNTSEHYRIFEQFYSVRSLETSNSILSKTHIIAKTQAEEAVREGVSIAAKRAATRAASKAEAYAEAAAKSAENAMSEAKSAAESAVNTAVENKMNTVTSKVSETSVTILGIFSGVVLTIVAGLFYSSSVLQSVNSANLFRLLSVASIVGLVCYHLLAIMFRFVERIKGAEKSSHNGWSVFISIVLIVIALISSILQFVFPDRYGSVSEEGNQTITTGDNDAASGSVSSVS